MASAISCRCSSVVFVGNIPYQANEEELREACEEIGPLESLRVAFDKDTGKPRGFAFAEYRDDETARSACRNLHGRPLRGRALRVGIQQRQRQHGTDRPVGVEEATHAASLVDYEHGGMAAPGEAVTRYLAGLSRRQVREFLGAVAGEREECVERAKREFRGLATLIEQARILVDMEAAASDEGVGGKRHAAGASGLPESGAPAAKLRKVDAGVPTVPGVACR
ncbi:cleavage stimulation factor subunit 2 [Brachypodium distachyon]|uniref:RRM domain-containing protein n=1 Tax=Brachypodium distachyon TaxID=15368 RepID=I1GWL0_BRADI|nr:cleavage stimulation factor subunit 2 [Brachypodium distachyon]KQK17354.1 hypothetical protein BRADI_1g33910v3 [Brachypodium distachyon]|eukprot:XP_014752030.1 cleavage stimulation factor subunit 2 [Brachypodium distachyon]